MKDTDFSMSTPLFIEVPFVHGLIAPDKVVLQGESLRNRYTWCS